MFTGIIEETGKIKNFKKIDGIMTFEIETNSILKGKKQGDSIAINGACMTIKDIKEKTFKFDVMPETLDITNFKSLKKSEIVNLESALKFNQSIDGHFLLGHVDITAKVEKSGTSYGRTKLTLILPDKIKKFIALKGSIAINGVSLTVSAMEKKTFSVDLIPLTLKETNLSKLKKGDKVNIEIDLIARYLNRLINADK